MRPRTVSPFTLVAFLAPFSVTQPLILTSAACLGALASWRPAAALAAAHMASASLFETEAMP